MGIIAPGDLDLRAVLAREGQLGTDILDVAAQEHLESDELIARRVQAD